MKNQNSGFLIAIEGIDGAGKSSLARSVAQHLKKLALPVLLTKEPGGTELGAAIRSLLQIRTVPISERAEFLLFAADRAQHFAQVVIPALKSGTLVISDRLADSSLAYQGYGRGLDREFIKQVNNWAMQNCTPDLIFYIRIDYKTALERIITRCEQKTAFEEEQAAFFQRVLAGFDEIYQDRSNVIILDGHSSLEKISSIATAHIKARLKLKNNYE